MNTITIIFSTFDKPLSFNLHDFSSIISLKYTENLAPLHQKEIVRAALVTLGLVDENDPKLSSTDLINLLSLQLVSTDNLIVLNDMEDLVAKLTTRKKGRDLNIFYTRYLSLIFEHLLGDAYKNDNLKTMNPHQITASYFKPSMASEHGAQPKALTDKKLRKKKITSSSEPKTSNISRESLSKKHVADTQCAEETMATADDTLSLDASELVEEQGNQLTLLMPQRDTPNLIESQSQHLHSKFSIHSDSVPGNDTLVEEEVMDSGITSVGNISFEELFDQNENKEADKEDYESPFDTESEINFVGKDVLTRTTAQIITTISIHQELHEDIAKIPQNNHVIREAKSDIESMPGDEIKSLYRFEADDDHHQSEHNEELSKTNEAATDNVIDDALTTKVEQLESSLAQQVTDKMEDFVPKMVDDAFEERMPKLVSDTLKNILPQIIKDSVNQSMKKSLPIEFNDLNKMESSRFVGLDKKLTKAIKTKVGKSVQHNVKREIKVVHELLKYCVGKIDKNVVDILELVNLIRDLVILIDPVFASPKAVTEGENMSTQAKKDPEITGEHVSSALVIQYFVKEPPTKKLKFVVENFTIPSLTPLNSIMPQGIKPPVIINNKPFEHFSASLFNSSSSEVSQTPPPIVADKGKGIATEEDPMNKLMPFC
ncbi:hypothetical protein Tco_1069175 [Tanacetum coccineum]|uniref:Uncharacterized protein n=1 Tax=Tanacetum coccineum TaxID=301880 RepID=A0ABQ5HJZ4_9ASTR